MICNCWLIVCMKKLWKMFTSSYLSKKVIQVFFVFLKVIFMLTIYKRLALVQISSPISVKRNFLLIYTGRGEIFEHYEFWNNPLCQFSSMSKIKVYHYLRLIWKSWNMRVCLIALSHACFYHSFLCRLSKHPANLP